MRQNVKDDNWSEAVCELPPVEGVLDIVSTNIKTDVAPDNEMWLLNWVHLKYVASAVVGNRAIGLHILDANDAERFSIEGEINQTAGNTVHYLFLQGTVRETTLSNNTDLISVIPKDLYLLPGWKIEVHDHANIDAAGDSMEFSYQYKKYVV